jgi:hypothetical protein
MQSTYYWQYSNGSLVRDETETINTIDGVYDGECTRVNNLDGVTYKGEYIDGVVQVQGTEQVDGQSVRVIYYTADKTGFSYYTNDSAYESKHSIYDF